MGLLTRKYFRQANITINTLSDIQLSTLQQIEEKYPIIRAVQVQRIIFFIEYGIEDLFSTFEKYFDPARRDNKLKTFNDLVSVFGNETATLIYSDRLKKISLGKRKTENQVEAFINSSLLFKEAEITYENLTPLQHSRLNNLLNCWSINELQDWKRQVIIFIKNDLTNYVGRIKRLRKHPGTNLYNTLLRYGKKECLLKFNEAANRRTLHFENREIYWINLGYSKEESKQRVSEVQNRRNRVAVELITGSSEYTCRSLVYWIKNGYSLLDAEQQVKRVQSRNHSLERNLRWQATLNNKTTAEKAIINKKKGHSIEAYIAAGFTAEEAKTKSINFYSKRKNYSNVSQKLFNMIVEKIGAAGLYFKTLNYEKQFYGKCVDFYDSISQTVIEFYGDFWHANPSFFSQEQIICGKPACFKRLDDKRLMNLIASHTDVKF